SSLAVRTSSIRCSQSAMSPVAGSVGAPTEDGGVAPPPGVTTTAAPGLGPLRTGNAGNGGAAGAVSCGEPEDRSAGVSPPLGTSVGLPPNQPRYRPPNSTPNTTRIPIMTPGRMRIL